MELPDFLDFEPFNQLRDAMGAEHLGDFVFFDPHKNLTGLERIELNNHGLAVQETSLYAAADFTLVYKDSRVLLYQPTPNIAADWRYHVADCEQIQALRREHLLHTWQARTSAPASNGNPPDDTQPPYKVCSDCLQKLRYQNFDAVRHRHKEYSQRVEEEFCLDEFFRHYPIYPIEIKEDIPIF